MAALVAAGLLLLGPVRRAVGRRAPSEDGLLAQQRPRAAATGRAKGAGAGAAAGAAADTDAAADTEADAGDAPRSLWQRRLDRAQRTLDTYREATRYPPTSRPLAEHPDQARPHAVADQTVHLKRPDDKLTDARATVRQDRYFLSGEERVACSITCATSDGPAPCEVLSTQTRAGGDTGASIAGRPIPFTAGGPEGGVSAVFQPSAHGFAGVAGPIQLFVDLRVAGEEGQVSFEVLYTPAAPAALTGAFREVLADGSLDLYAGIRVDKPGRYVISARADDAGGRPFAYLSFNEELGAGAQEIRLRLFGRLIRDQNAVAPFRLRDIEGFLLKEDVYPDRESIAPIEGLAYTTKRHPARDFSGDAWESAEKERQESELVRSVAEAKGHVDQGE